MRDLYADARFGTVLWINALAHDKHFWRTLDEIKRVLKPGGTLIVVVPGFSKSAGQTGISITGQKGSAIADATITYKVHDAPDYWRLSPQGLERGRSRRLRRPGASRHDDAAADLRRRR